MGGSRLNNGAAVCGLEMCACVKALSERVYRCRRTEELNFFRDGRFCGIGPLGGQRFAFTCCCCSEEFFFFARVACQLELLELTAFTQPSALAACLQAATARLPCVLCSAPTPTRRRQRPRTRHAFV